MTQKIVFVILLLCSVYATAQPSKGKMLLGGSFSYNTSTTGYTSPAPSLYDLSQTNSNYNLSFGLHGGYFITDHVALGVSGRYSVAHSSEQSALPSISSDLSTADYGIFGRTYCKLADKFYFTNTLSFTFQSGTDKTNNNNYPLQPTHSEQDINGIAIGLTPAVTYFIKPGISLNFSLGNITYMNMLKKNISGFENNDGATFRTNSFNLSLPFSSVGFGIDFLFGGCNKTSADAVKK